MSEYEAKFHPEFFNDLKKLTKTELKDAYKHIQKIKQDPAHQKHLEGGSNCYRSRIGNLRMVYCIFGATIWFLVIERRDKVYDTYRNRLYKIRQQMGVSG